MISAVPASSQSAARLEPVFHGRARWAAAAVLVAGGLLQVVEFALENAPDDNLARVQAWSEHLTRQGLSSGAGLLAVPFLLGGIAVLVALTRGRSPRLAWTAGGLLTFAMVGLAAVHGYELAAYGLARTGDLAGASRVLDGSDLGVPGPVMLVMFLGCAVAGTLVLAAAVWRSPLVPRVVALFIVGFAVVDFAVGWGLISHLVNLLGLTIVAVAVVLGYVRGWASATRESDESVDRARAA
jgi:hypothetical protein